MRSGRFRPRRPRSTTFRPRGSRASRARCTRNTRLPFARPRAVRGCTGCPDTCPRRRTQPSRRSGFIRFFSRTASRSMTTPRAGAAGLREAVREKKRMNPERLAEHDDDARRRRLSSPPWLATSPDAVPLLLADSPQITTQTPLVRYLASKFRWPHLFMCFERPDGERPGTYNTAWVAGLADQTLRNLDIARPERASRLAERLFDVSPSAYTAALRAEALRLSGRTGDTRAFLDSLPERGFNAPVVALAPRARA